MPIFEYRCHDCGHEFEAIVRASRPAACPTCNSNTLDKKLSVFAVGGADATGDLPAACAPCGQCNDPRGPGACALN